MNHWHNAETYHRIGKRAIWCMAALLSLVPWMAPAANGQAFVVITVLVGVQTNEPAVAPPAVEPSPTPLAEPAATSESTPIDPQTTDEPSPSEPTKTDAPQTEVPSATEGVAPSQSTLPTVSAKLDESSSQPTAEVVQGSGNQVESIPADRQEKTSSVPAESKTTTQPPLEQALSVGPTSSLLPSDRPAWITQEADLKSDNHTFVVASIPTVRQSEVDSNLDSSLEEAVRSYASELVGDEHAGDLLASRLSSAFVRTNLICDQFSYTAELSTTSGPMFQKWVMVEVTPEQQEVIRTWYQEQIQRERLLPLGLALFAFLGFIAIGNIAFRRSASKSDKTVQPLKVIQPEASASCCGRKSRWGYAIAVATAIVVACLVAK